MYNHLVSARRLALPLVVLVAAVLAGCQQREVEKVLKVTDVNTGWYDVGIVAGQNKIVPSVSFHLQNVSPEPIENVQINAVFRRLDEAESWGDRLIRGVGSDGLAARRHGQDARRAERTWLHGQRAARADVEELGSSSTRRSTCSPATARGRGSRSASFRSSESC